MADLPHHRDTDKEPGAVSDGRPLVGTRRRMYLFVVVAVALVLLMVVLHLTGTVGAGAH